MKPVNFYGKIISVLNSLKKDHPQYSMGKHLSTALDGYDLWSMTDKSVYEALSRYEAELEFDIPHDTTSEQDIDIIIRDGKNLYKFTAASLMEDED